MTDSDPTLHRRFWSKVDKATIAPCWRWTGTTIGYYGRCNAGGRLRYAHFVAWMLTHPGAPVPSRFFWTCATRGCVNPAHLIDKASGQGRARTNPASRVVSDPARRFWMKVNKNGPVLRSELGHCWVWTAALVSGYGRFGLNGKWIRATAYSLALSGVGVPDGLVICHRCDNPPCVRPDHLFVGTRKDNSHDAAVKGRLRQRACPVSSKRDPESESDPERPAPDTALVQARRVYVAE